MIDKTKYTEVGGSNRKTDRTMPEKGSRWQKGDKIEGRFIETKTVKGKKGEVKLHLIETPDELVGIWGSTVLDNKFSQITPGKVVGVEYLGKKESKNGGEYNDFFVGIGINTVGDEGGPTKKKYGDFEEEEIDIDEIPF